MAVPYLAVPEPFLISVMSRWKATKSTMTAMALIMKATPEVRVAMMPPMVLPESRLKRKAMSKTPVPMGCKMKTRVRAFVVSSRAVLKSASSTPSSTLAGL